MPEAAAYDATFYTRLRRRTAWVGALVFIIPFALFSFVVDFASERYIRDQALERLGAGVETNARLLDDVFANRTLECESLARAISDSLWKRSDLTSALRGFRERHPWYRLLVVTDARGTVVAASEELRGTISEEQSIARARAGQTVLSDIFFWPATQHEEMLVAVPLRTRDGQVAGVFVAALNLDRLAKRLLRFGTGETEETFLVTPEGLFAAPRPGTQGVRLPAFEAGSTNPFRGEAGRVEFTDDRGQKVLAAYRKLGEKDYYLAARVSWGELQGRVRALRREILLYVAPFLLLGVVLAVAAWRYAMDKIHRLLVELYQALAAARRAAEERDLAHQQLARRFEEERELARQKAQFQAQLAEYEKYAALAELALGAAHEINNPLLGILTHLELELRALERRGANDASRRDVRDADDAEMKQEIEQSIAAARRISATVRALLNYARPVPLQISQVRLDRLVDETLAFLSHHPMFRNIKIDAQISADLPPLEVDANQMSQILTNLLLNAAQAMPEGGAIRVSAERQPAPSAPLGASEEKVEIRVADTGCGIPPEVLPRIFDPFFTTKRGHGTGLGLSITQAYVRSHGGEIRVESAPLQGTTVTIVLPIHQKDRPVEDVLEVVT